MRVVDGTVSKLACRAALCYNTRNIVRRASARNTNPTLAHLVRLTRRCTVDTIPPHAQESNLHYIIIPLANTRYAIIDFEDADLAEYKWHFNSYAARLTGKRKQFMHRVILERKLGRPIQEGMLADHINRDRCDNRRANLREVTLTQNMWNSKRQKNNTTQYIGVSRQGNYYIARIGGQRDVLGRFTNPEDAGFCYDKAALELRGEFAVLNHPIEEVRAWIPPQPFLHVTNTSGYRGVTKIKGEDKWQATYKHQGKPIHLGIYDTPEDAAKAYDLKVIELKVDKPYLNFSAETYQNSSHLPARRKLHSKTGYRGIWENGNRWAAEITRNGISRYLGSYPTPEQAARAYDRIALELDGERALLNFPREDYENT